MVWASVTERPGDAFFESGVEFTRKTVVFVIRHRTDISRRNRVRWNGEAYDVTGIVVIGREIGLELHCELEPVRS